jgi:hypothetical protein
LLRRFSPSSALDYELADASRTAPVLVR